ncbi:MAG: cytochrome c biogenesis protein CcsA [Chitinivorax sp.]
MLALSLLITLAYSGLAWHFWRTRWRSLGPAHPREEQFALMTLLIGHGALLIQGFTQSSVLGLSAGSALSLTLWLSVAIFWSGSFYYRLDGIQPLLLPAAALATLAGALTPTLHGFQGAELPAFRAHIMAAILSYSLLTIAALIAVLMSVADKRLHQHTHNSLAANLPPLLGLESLLFKVLGAGFVLLTLTLASGILFSEEIFHKPFQLNHKNLFTLIAWLVFALLLTGRQMLGWRGRTAVRWTLSGFSLLLLAYIGSKFVLEVLLHRQ